MAQYDFNFPQDSTVALKLGRGSTINVPKRTTKSGDDGLTLELTRTDLRVAPDFVGLLVTPTTQLLPQFSGLTVYDRHFHEDWYEIDWGDDGCSDYITGDTLSAWGNRNVSLHRRSGHVYETPGTYTITVSRYDAAGVLLSQAKEPITINDPDVVFPAARTIVVVDGGSEGDTTGAPAHDHVHGEITSALAFAGNQSVPMRILVKRGEGKDYTMDGRQYRNKPNLYISTFGSGSKPVMKAAPSYPSDLLIVFECNYVGSVVAGFDLQGNWDSTTEHVIGGTVSFGDGIRVYDSGFLIVHDCDASGFSCAFGCVNPTPTNKVVVSQSTVTNWQDYGIFLASAAGNQTWLLGVRLNQHVDALSGGRGKVKGVGYAGNDHGPLRAQCYHLVMEGLEGFSRNAWTPTAANGVDDSQNPMRLQLNGPGKTVCGNRILAEGGAQLYSDGNPTGSVKRGMNIRLTNVIYMGNYVTKEGVLAGNGGLTIENMLYIRSDNPVATGTQTNRNAFALVGAKTAADNQDENNASPVRVRNPTVINLTTDKNTVNNSGSHVTFSPVGGENNFEDSEVHDLVEYTVRTNSAHDDGPFDLVALREPLYKGQRFGFENVKGTVPVTVPPGGEMTLPYPTGSKPSDYFAEGWTQVLIKGAGNFDTKNKQIALVFGAQGITVTNLTATTWTQGSDLTARLDRRRTPPPFTQATPAGSYHLYHPASGNAALVGGATGSNVPRRDLLMRVRPKTPSKGALEPI